MKITQTGIIRTALPAAAVIWRLRKMTNTTMNCIKAVGVGIAAGVAAGAICKYACSRKRSMKYRAKHAANVMEDLIENVVYMFK